MSQRDDTIGLRYLIAHAKEAIALAASRSRADLETDRVFELALTRLIEVVGEAAGQLSTDTTRRAPNLPWREMAGMRHKLIHGYFAVDRDILWTVAARDLPAILPDLEALLAALEGQ